MIGAFLHPILPDKREIAQLCNSPARRFARYVKPVSLNAGAQAGAVTRACLGSNRYPSPSRRSDLPQVRPPIFSQSANASCRPWNLALFEHSRYLSNRAEQKTWQVNSCAFGFGPEWPLQLWASRLAAALPLNKASRAWAPAQALQPSLAVISQPAPSSARWATWPIARSRQRTAASRCQPSDNLTGAFFAGAPVVLKTGSHFSAGALAPQFHAFAALAPCQGGFLRFYKAPISYLRAQQRTGTCSRKS